MDTPLRSIVKAVSWQVLGLITVTFVAYAFTGSFASAGGLALGAASTSLVFFFLHERVWGLISWGRIVQPASRAAVQTHRAGKGNL